MFSRLAICRAVFLSAVIVLTPCYDTESSTILLTGNEIKSHISFYNGPVITDSDSLVLNDRPLVRNIDYTIDYLHGSLRLLIDYSLRTDTLVVYFKPLPSWLKLKYGNLPEQVSAGETVIGTGSPYSVPEPAFGRVSGVYISGAKRFSILTQSGGASQFNQALELTITGELAPGVSIAGSVADRGYDPSYGTINSRISELDKIYLTIRAAKFKAEIGNLELPQKSLYGRPALKQVSGLSAEYHDRVFSSGVVVARPRGVYNTVKLAGADRVQGPYRLITGNRVLAVVPGSERVWVDGELLERGADKDYTFDYPAASMTFTSKVPIDSRSRIEVDFEPLTDDYQRELYSVSSGLSVGDSSLLINVGYIREGDDKNRLKSGELTDQDREFLQSIGDSVLLNFRDGAVVDIYGDYIEQFDTLGVRYFEYAGDSLGDWRVAFTPVGGGNGDYIFSGGNRYDYVGENRGDYLPSVPVPVPQRLELAEADIEFRPFSEGRFTLKTRHSILDKNLLSSLNDNNNHDGEYVFAGQVGSLPQSGSRKSGLLLNASYTGSDFNPDRRRIKPDRTRRYIIPGDLVSAGNEYEINLGAAIVLPGAYNALLDGGLLDYDDGFTSGRMTVRAYPDRIDNLLPTASFTRIEARYDTSEVKRKGIGDIVHISIDGPLKGSLNVISSFKYDRRTNDYSSFSRGTTEKEIKTGLKYKESQFTIERYEEDTLQSGWKRKLRRDRAVLSAMLKIGPINSEIYLLGQKYRFKSYNDDQMLARVHLRYNPSSTRLAMSGSYTISDENRYERGVRYLEVEPGQGKYILQDSQYVPDPEGNYIEVEEIRSGQAAVKKGEKSFSLSYNPRDVYLRLSSSIDEDLAAYNGRNMFWLLPFYSDGTKAYQYRKLYHTGDLKLFSRRGYYVINLGGVYNYENRNLAGGNAIRREQSGRLTVKEGTETWRFVQEGTYFEYFRKGYTVITDDIDGYKASAGVSYYAVTAQIKGDLSYRFARDANGDNSRQYRLEINPVVRMFNSGEISLKIEGYIQKLNGAAMSSYRLTDNLSGKRGGVWTMRADYKIKKDFRLTLSFSGRHSDDRKPRIVGRGEFVASF